MRANSLICKVMQAIKRKKSSTVMRGELAFLGDYDQIGRCLRQLVDKKVLVRLGYGIYVKAPSPLSRGRVPFDASVQKVSLEIIKKLKKAGVRTPLRTKLDEKKPDRISVELPFYIKGSINRKLTYQGKKIDFKMSQSKPFL